MKRKKVLSVIMGIIGICIVASDTQKITENPSSKSMRELVEKIKITLPYQEGLSIKEKQVLEKLSWNIQSIKPVISQHIKKNKEKELNKKDHQNEL